MKTIYNCKANDLSVVWYSYNGQMALTDACKQITYMVKQLNYVWLMYINSIMVKFYCDAITRSRLQLINTSIVTFVNKPGAFLAEQRRRRKASDG